MRSVLTALGIIIGVGAVIAMVGIGNGAKAQVEAQIASLGQNVILIFSGSTTSSGIRTGWGGAGTLKVEDAEAIRREVPGVIGVSEEVVSTTQVAAGNQNWFTRIYGESADYFDIRQWPLADGAPFTPQDVRSANKVCVIGRTTATQIYGNEDPVGQILRVKEVPFTITGVLRIYATSTCKSATRDSSKQPSNKLSHCFDNGITFGPAATTISRCATNRKSPKQLRQLRA
jgi:putative ABC transport system permease protein